MIKESWKRIPFDGMECSSSVTDSGLVSSTGVLSHSLVSSGTKDRRMPLVFSEKRASR